MLSSLDKVLLDQSWVTPRQLGKARARAGAAGLTLPDALLELGFISEEELVQAIARTLGVTYVDLDAVQPDPEVRRLVPDPLALLHQVFPLAREGNRLTLGMVNPLNLPALDEIHHLTGLDLDVSIVSPSALTRALNQPDGASNHFPFVESDCLSALTQRVFAEAIIGGYPSDTHIHIEPQPSTLRIRYRKDGVLREVMTLPHHHKSLLVGSIKRQACLDLAQQGLPQVGRIAFSDHGSQWDLHVSTLPTVQGEKVVVSVVERASPLLGISRLALLPDTRQRLETLLKRDSGLLLVTGPADSGKWTTLFACMTHLNKGDRNLITVEGWVRRWINGLTQVQINPQLGLTFAAALQSFAQQDPDVILVGQIRDGETARLALTAAQRGSQVLASFFSQDASGALSRLIDMGVDPSLLASALSGVLGQRLALGICDDCKEIDPIYPQALGSLLPQLPPDREAIFWRGRGCDSCRGSGCRGRIGIHELLSTSERIRGLLRARASTTEIRAAAVRDGMRTLAGDALHKALDGLISVQHCAQAIYLDGLEPL